MKAMMGIMQADDMDTLPPTGESVLTRDFLAPPFFFFFANRIQPSSIHPSSFADYEGLILSFFSLFYILSLLLFLIPFHIPLV